MPFFTAQPAEQFRGTRARTHVPARNDDTHRNLQRLPTIGLRSRHTGTISRCTSQALSRMPAEVPCLEAATILVAPRRCSATQA